MPTRSGIKTSEFWVSLIVILLGAFMTSGLFANEHWSMKVVGLVTSLLSALGYTFARASVKLAAAETAAISPTDAPSP